MQLALWLLNKAAGSGLWVELSEDICLAFVRLWVPSAGLQKESVQWYTSVIPATQEPKAGGSFEFETSLSNIVRAFSKGKN
jgi:hypothetical protein